MDDEADRSPLILRYAAFTLDGAGGNPAGVVLDARGLSAARRLAIAAELGYSETAFLEPPENGVGRLRFYSPLAEVSFCGHATVATAVALAERDGPGSVVFSTAAGPVPVLTSRDREGPLTATLTTVPTSSRAVSDGVVGKSLAALRWTASDLDVRYPPRIAFAGAQHLILAVRERERLAALDYDVPALGELMDGQGWTTVDLVWAESPSVFHARNPFPPGGVYEDPATGAAAGALGGYLRDLGAVEPPCRITVLQGQDMGRPSRLIVDIPGEPDSTIRVTGAAHALAGQ